MPELLEEQRENWGSRAGFVLAAIGSAVGLGNLWGFPYKLYAYGGGAFLIPYIAAMLVIGVPVLIMEFSLGHMTQRAAPDAFRATNRRSEVFGWWGILLGSVIITYYPVVLAYCLHFFAVSVHGIFTGGELPWAAHGAEGVSRASDYFFKTYLNTFGDGEAPSPWALGSPIGEIVLSLVVVWVLMYFCIFRGVRLVSKVVLWTVPLPWLMLLILTVRGLTLDGAAQGLEYYLHPNWSELAKPTTWRFAFGQVFFSMSLAFGVMITYASFLHRKSDINNNAMVVGLGDLATSFVAGIAVFATLGGMAMATGQHVTDVVKAGPGLAFVAFPYALAQFPHSAWFSAVFFFALVTLGIDSAFSITESVLASLVDKTRWNRNVVLIVMSLIGLATGLIYCTRGGLNWLDKIDGFINGPWGITFVGLGECVVLGWMYRISRLRQHANERSDWRLGAWWDVLIRFVAPVVLAALFAWSLVDELTKPEGYLFSAVNGQQRVNWFTVATLILSAIAPIGAVILSAIHSPGGDTHAVHKGQPVGPRSLGVAGLVMAVAALAGVAASIVLICRGDIPGWLGQFLTRLSPESVPILIWPPLLALVLAVGGLISGAMCVIGSELRSMRPSRLARGAAAISVMCVGAAAGLGLSVWMKSLSTAAHTTQYADTMSGWSYGVLVAMLALIVVGLGWCFYMALKSAGREEPVQLPEDGEAA